MKYKIQKYRYCGEWVVSLLLKQGNYWIEPESSARKAFNSWREAINYCTGTSNYAPNQQ